MVDAIHAGALDDATTEREPIFGMNVVTDCPNVNKEILVPRNTWSDPSAYDATAKKLASLFHENFKNYEEKVTEGVRAAGPTA